MNKKTLTIVLALALSVTLFAGTALAAGNHLEGYELLKDVMMKADGRELDSGTVAYEVTVRDNGDVLIESDGQVTMDVNENAAFTGTLGDGNVRKSFAASRVDDQLLLEDVDNKLFYQVEKDAFEDTQDYGHGHYGEDYDGDYGDHGPMTANEERLFDALVGDMKNKVTLKDLGDGNREIEFTLLEDDVPMAVNLLLSIAAEEDHAMDPSGQDKMASLQSVFPFFEDFDLDRDGHDFLQSDVKVLRFSLSLMVDPEDQVTGFTVEVSMDGYDAQGDYHRIDIEGHLSVLATEVALVEPLKVDGDLMVIDADKAAELEALFED